MRVRRLEVGTNAGFSLLEVVIAIGILSFGMLGLALMQLYSLSQSSMGRHTGDAASIGRSYVEQMHRLPWATLTAVSGAGWQVPVWAAAQATTVRVNGPQGRWFGRPKKRRQDSTTSRSRSRTRRAVSRASAS